MNNKQAHQTLKLFNKICDKYNENKLVPSENKILLKLDQVDAQRARKLFINLLERFRSSDGSSHKVKEAEALENYMIFNAIILLRLSCLIHENRKETYEEKINHLNKVRKKYKLTLA